MRSSSPSGSSWAGGSSLALGLLLLPPILLAPILGACEQGATLGTACERTTACASPLVCRLGRCRVECVENRDCPVGSQCFLDPGGLGACQLDVDDRCGGGCPDGLECLADACVRSCSAPQDCPADGLCATASGAGVGVCVDPRRLEDAATPDAGTGDADLVDASTPDASDGGTTGFVSLCVGQQFACAVRGTDGAVLCWGQTGDPFTSRLGNGTFDGVSIEAAAYETCTDGSSCSTRPVRVQALRADQSGTEPMTAATQVVCGGDHACALRSGRAWCWGANYAYQRGEDDVLARPYAGPTDLEGERLLSGRQHVCLQRGDALSCWGGNEYEQVGRTTSAGELPGIAFASGVRHATLGAYVTCVEDASGAVSCMGWNGAAQLGRPVTELASSSAPLSIEVGGSGGLAAGTRFLCASDAAGIPRCWGTFDRGVLGREGTGFDPVPAVVTGSPRYAALFTGPQGDQVCGRRLDGTVECWGDNQHGTVGIPPALGTVISEPSVIASLRGATDIAFGEGAACALIEGSVLCWGANGAGQLGQGSSDALAHFAPVLVSFPAE